MHSLFTLAWALCWDKSYIRFFFKGSKKDTLCCQIRPEFRRPEIAQWGHFFCEKNIQIDLEKNATQYVWENINKKSSSGPKTTTARTVLLLLAMRTCSCCISKIDSIWCAFHAVVVLGPEHDILSKLPQHAVARFLAGNFAVPRTCCVLLHKI